jgi:hypothetical protein
MSKEPIKDEKMSMHAWRIRQSVLETAEERGKRKARVQMAQKALALKLDWATISELIGLDLEDIERLAKGKKIDID